MLAVTELTHVELVEKLKQTLADERDLVADSLVYLHHIAMRRIHMLAGYSSLIDFLVNKLGMTRSVAYKRSMAAKLLQYFPELLPLLRKGDISVTHMVLMHPKLTKANYEKVVDAVRGKSKREAELFLSCIDTDGSIINREKTVEIHFEANEELIEMLDRARKILAGKRQKTSQREVISAALDAFLDKNDPERKARRHEERKEKSLAKTAAKKEIYSGDIDLPDEDYPYESPASNYANDENSRVAMNFSPGAQCSRHIPADIRHQVYLRDGGRCSFIHEDGSRCEATAFLHIDHIAPWSRGGAHTLENVRLLCSCHNQMAAKKVFGREFIERKIQQKSSQVLRNFALD